MLFGNLEEAQFRQKELRQRSCRWEFVMIEEMGGSQFDWSREKDGENSRQWGLYRPF